MIKEECYPLGVVVLLLAEQVFLPLGKAQCIMQIYNTQWWGERAKRKRKYFMFKFFMSYHKM